MNILGDMRGVATKVREASGRKSAIALAGVILLSTVTGGAASAALGLQFNQTVNVTLGEVTQAQSDLYITSVDYSGPGNDVDTVTITVENNGGNQKTGNLQVALIDEKDGTVVAKNASSETITVGTSSPTTVDVSLNTSVSRANFTTTDIQIGNVST